MGNLLHIFWVLFDVLVHLLLFCDGEFGRTSTPFMIIQSSKTSCVPGIKPIIYHPQSGWFEDTPLKGGAEEGYPLKGVHEGTCLFEARQHAWNHSRASW